VWLASHAFFMLIEIHGRQHLWNFIAKLLVIIELFRDLCVALLKSLSIHDKYLYINTVYIHFFIANTY
jgi:hypothetical protein